MNEVKNIMNEMFENIKQFYVTHKVITICFFMMIGIVVYNLYMDKFDDTKKEAIIVEVKKLTEQTNSNLEIEYTGKYDIQRFSAMLTDKSNDEDNAKIIVKNLNKYGYRLGSSSNELSRNWYREKYEILCEKNKDGKVVFHVLYHK